MGDSEGPDQTAHMCSLIRAYTVLLQKGHCRMRPGRGKTLMKLGIGRLTLDCCSDKPNNNFSVGVA